MEEAQPDGWGLMVSLILLQELHESDCDVAKDVNLGRLYYARRAERTLRYFYPLSGARR